MAALDALGVSKRGEVVLVCGGLEEVSEASELLDLGRGQGKAEGIDRIVRLLAG